MSSSTTSSSPPPSDDDWDDWGASGGDGGDGDDDDAAVSLFDGTVLPSAEAALAHDAGVHGFDLAAFRDKVKARGRQGEGVEIVSPGDVF